MADDNATPVLPNVNKAAQAWYDYILRGRRSRVMSPMDEMPWFVAPATGFTQIDNTSGWVELLASNPMRVGVIISVDSPIEFATDFQALSFDFTGTVDGAGNISGQLRPHFVDPDVPLNQLNDQWVYMRFGDNNGLAGIEGHAIRPQDGFIKMTQSEWGALVQSQIWVSTGSTTITNISFTELILRDFPRM